VVAPSVCQSSVGNLFHVTLMGSRILNFWNHVSYIYRIGILLTPSATAFHIFSQYPYWNFWDTLHYLLHNVIFLVHKTFTFF
jgi:hypothetical protein